MNPEKEILHTHSGALSPLMWGAVFVTMVLATSGAYLFVNSDNFFIEEKTIISPPVTISESIRTGTAEIPVFTEAVAAKQLGTSGV